MSHHEKLRTLLNPLPKGKKGAFPNFIVGKIEARKNLVGILLNKTMIGKMFKTGGDPPCSHPADKGADVRKSLLRIGGKETGS
jgi:hypothetical protein